MQVEKTIQKAEDELEYLTGDAITKRLAEFREKAYNRFFDLSP